MYLHASGSPVRERVAIGSPLELGAAPGQSVRRFPVRRGHRGGLVFAIQRMLNNWVAKWRLSLAPLREDGAFGAATGQRVRAFQRALALKEDGAVGPATARWLDQVVGVPLALGQAGAPRDAAEEAGAKEGWAHRHAQCLDLKTAGLRSAAAAIIGDAAFTGLTMDRIMRDLRLHAVLERLGPRLHEAGLLTPRMREEIGAAVRAGVPVIGWVALDIVLRLSARCLRCAADLEWPPRRGTP